MSIVALLQKLQHLCIIIILQAIYIKLYQLQFSDRYIYSHWG